MERNGKHSRPGNRRKPVHDFYCMIDTKMVAGMGRRAVSAVSLTNQPKLFFFTIYFALATCLTICVSNSYGKKDSAEASK